MFIISCTLVALSIFLLGSTGNGLCILVFLRKKFRYRIITPYFIVLLSTDSIYLFLRLTKLFHYTLTVFQPKSDGRRPCTDTLFSRAYAYATQTWPQTLVPLLHPETYMRFSLMLMAVVSVQRTTIITRSLNRLVAPVANAAKSKYRWIILIISSVFLVAYAFEFFSLTLFCSRSNNSEQSYQWFLHLGMHMKNSSSLLTESISDHPEALRCVNSALAMLSQQQQSDPSSAIVDTDACSQVQLKKILSHYFDLHEKSIVHLIQGIALNQTGRRMTRQDIRRKYHFHECLFPQEPAFFHQYYDFIYKRGFGLNRHVLILGKTSLCGVERQT